MYWYSLQSRPTLERDPWIVFRNDVVPPSWTLILPESWDESKSVFKGEVDGFQCTSEFSLKNACSAGYGKMLVCDKCDRAINCMFCHDHHLTLRFSAHLQKDLIKENWSLAKSCFQGLLISGVSVTSASHIFESFWNIWSQVSQRKKPFSDFPARGPGVYTLLWGIHEVAVVVRWPGKFKSMMAVIENLPSSCFAVQYHSLISMI